MVSIIVWCLCLLSLPPEEELGFEEMAEMDLFILVLHSSTYFAFVHRRGEIKKVKYMRVTVFFYKHI